MICCICFRGRPALIHIYLAAFKIRCCYKKSIDHLFLQVQTSPFFNHSLLHTIFSFLFPNLIIPSFPPLLLFVNCGIKQQHFCGCGILRIFSLPEFRKRVHPKFHTELRTELEIAVPQNPYSLLSSYGYNLPPTLPQCVRKKLRLFFFFF